MCSSDLGVTAGADGLASGLVAGGLESGGGLFVSSHGLAPV